MVIYTRILDKPDEIVSCSAQLTDFPEVCDTLFHLDLKSLWFNTEQTRFYPGLNLLLQLLKAQASNWKCTELYRVFVSLLQDVDIDLKKSNQESLLEAGCLLLIKEELPSPETHSLYTHIRSLQRLKVCHFSPIFTISSSIYDLRAVVSNAKPAAAHLKIRKTEADTFS